MAYRHGKYGYCRHPSPTPTFKTPNSYVHNVIITPYIDIIMLFSNVVCMLYWYETKLMFTEFADKSNSLKHILLTN